MPTQIAIKTELWKQDVLPIYYQITGKQDYNNNGNMAIWHYEYGNYKIEQQTIYKHLIKSKWKAFIISILNQIQLKGDEEKYLFIPLFIIFILSIFPSLKVDLQGSVFCFSGCQIQVFFFWIQYHGLYIIPLSLFFNSSDIYNFSLLPYYYSKYILDQLYYLYSQQLFTQTISLTGNLKYIIFYIRYMILKDIKDQAIDKCKQAWNFTENNARKLYSWITQNQQITHGVSKTRDFYQNHQEACIGVGIALVAFVLIRRQVKKNRQEARKQQQQKQNTLNPEENIVIEKQEKKKSHIAIVPPATSKKFMDEEDVQFFPDEPSTDIVRKQKNGKKKGKNEQESSQDDNRQDRIFFQMYNTYRRTDDQV